MKPTVLSVLLLGGLFLQPGFGKDGDAPPSDGKSGDVGEARTPEERPKPVSNGPAKTSVKEIAPVEHLMDFLDSEQIVLRMLSEEILGDLLYAPAADKLLKLVEKGPAVTVFPPHIRKMYDEKKRERVEMEMLWKERGMVLENLGKLGVLTPDAMDRILAMTEKEEVDIVHKVQAELELIRQDEKRREGGAMTAFKTQGGAFWTDEKTKEQRFGLQKSLTGMVVDASYFNYRKAVGIPAALRDAVDPILARLPKRTRDIDDSEMPEYTVRLQLVRSILAEYWIRIDREIHDGRRFRTMETLPPKSGNRATP